MSEASDQITEYLSVGGLFNPEIMNQTQHEAVRDTLIKARDDIQSLERYNAALREQVEKLDANWKMAEDQCFDQVGKIGELERENAALRADKERLDWLEGQIRCGFYNHATGRTELSALSCHHVKTIGIRAVIDSKRKEAQP